VALTFDDGPGASTQQIIDILQREHVTATFFNLGENEVNNAALVREEARDGYALGDHTWDHTDLTTLDADQQAAEIDRERAEQAKITGHESCLFRPPYGSIDDTTVSLTQARDMTIWDWSVDTEDWKADGSDSSYWVHRIIRRADAGGSQQHPVVLMHNQPAGNPATVDALSHVITYYRAHGYRFVDLLGDTGRPDVTAVRPATGSTAGGHRVVIRGDNFRDVTDVRFGREEAAAVRVESPSKIIATTPQHPAGVFDVTVASADHGRSSPVAADRFRFVRAPTISAVDPASGPTAGGRKIRILGTGFVDLKKVHIGRMVVTPNRVIGATRIWVTTPPHAAGTLDITVTTTFGSSPKHPADQYTYRDAPS
jgi:peptidoglycan/xylan/chitin deacetylase (PgdA/CDA1 family)